MRPVNERQGLQLSHRGAYRLSEQSKPSVGRHAPGEVDAASFRRDMRA